MEVAGLRVRAIGLVKVENAKVPLEVLLKVLLLESLTEPDILAVLVVDVSQPLGEGVMLLTTTALSQLREGVRRMV